MGGGGGGQGGGGFGGAPFAGAPSFASAASSGSNLGPGLGFGPLAGPGPANTPLGKGSAPAAAGAALKKEAATNDPFAGAHLVETLGFRLGRSLCAFCFLILYG